MRIEQLEYLREVVKRRSMNKASEKLHVAQQTLSTAIKSLENELDVKLLDRTYQGVFPTTIGQEVVDWADTVLNGLDYLKLKIATQKEATLSGQLRIATDRGINMMVMPKVISHFHRFHPQINIHTFEYTRQEIEAAVLDKTIDLGLIVHYDHLPPNFSADSPLIYVEILNYTFYARVNKNNPLATESAVSLRSLLNYPLAMLNLGTSDGTRMLEQFQQYGSPQIWQTRNPFLASQLVSDNQAVSISVKINNYASPFFSDYEGTIVTLPIKEPIPFYSSYLIHRDNLGMPSIDRFIETLTKIT